MVNITLALPDELKEEMAQFPEMNWSVIARAAIKQRLILLKQIKQFTVESELTEEDAIKLGRKISKAVSSKTKQRRK